MTEHDLPIVRDAYVPPGTEYVIAHAHGSLAPGIYIPVSDVRSDADVRASAGRMMLEIWGPSCG